MDSTQPVVRDGRRLLREGALEPVVVGSRVTCGRGEECADLARIVDQLGLIDPPLAHHARASAGVSHDRVTASSGLFQHSRSSPVFG